MGAEITYMGTKRALAATVAEVSRVAKPGVLLDAFSGMCAVGSAVAQDRQVWNNDIQHFAAEVARALFLSQSDQPKALDLADACFASYARHQERLSEAFKDSLLLEARVTESSSYKTFQRNHSAFRARLRINAGLCEMRSERLFTTTYAGNFFGLRQAIEIDSITYALRRSREAGAISIESLRWGRIALGRALLKTSNSTGHFAQYLKPNEKTWRRFVSLRTKLVWSEWLNSISLISPVGQKDWRHNNQVFHSDSLTLLKRLGKRGVVGAIYADPPYTDDQYSRYYHILETLLLYDYPVVSGAGLYRPGRFRTPFSLRSTAGSAMSQLVESASKTGADLILSYPANGLAITTGLDIIGLLKKHYKKVEVSRTMVHQHSTFGASKGKATTEATELLYLARA